MSGKQGRVEQLFDLTGRVAIVTGGAGLLGYHHGAILAEAGANVVLLDLAAANPSLRADQLQAAHGPKCLGLAVDITSEHSIEGAEKAILAEFGRIDILINNAANNPKVEAAGGLAGSRLESYSLENWNRDLAVGLTGAMLCSRVFGAEMARRGRGVILNIASDLALIAPDQRLYAVEGRAREEQPVKPVSYSVVKSGLVGLTRYLATYWADRGVRVNALCPGGVENGQDPVFLGRIAERIPMGRMAKVDEYQGTIVFLCSDASSYMTGAVVAVDGGRTAW